MSHETSSDIAPQPPMVCQIRLAGHLGRQWADWFDGLTITLADNGETLLTGSVPDQAALHGLLRKVRDLGIPLLSVVCTDSGEAETGEPSTRTEKRA